MTGARLLQDFCRLLVPPMTLPNMAFTAPLAAFLRTRAAKGASPGIGGSAASPERSAAGGEHSALVDAVCFFPQAVHALAARCAARNDAQADSPWLALPPAGV